VTNLLNAMAIARPTSPCPCANRIPPLITPIAQSVVETASGVTFSTKGGCRHRWLSGSMAIAIGTEFMALAAAAFLTIPQKLIHVYTHDGQTVAVVVRLLAVSAVFQVFDAVQGVGTGALRGLGNAAPW
jgi:hypothetical protein